MGFSDNWRGREHQGRRNGGPIRPIFDRSEGHGEKPDYKTAALCKQVRRALSMALAGDCADELLQSLVVDEVLPAPNASRLLVRIILRASGGAVSIPHVLQRLEQVRGLLRARIGEAIVRKRTPELAFDIILFDPAPGAGEEADHE
jgi:ribosome-binding factor A